MLNREAKKWSGLIKSNSRDLRREIEEGNSGFDVILLQKTRENLRVPEVTRSPAISTSPNRQLAKSSTPADHYYGIEVPTTHEVTYNNDKKLLEAKPTLEPRPQELYSSQIASLTIGQITPSLNNDARNNGTIVQSQNNVISTTTRSLSSTSEGSRMNINRKGSYFGQALPQSPQKLEISHPVSRLCDTIESIGKIDRFANVEADKLENETRIEDKLAERVIINSDNNNNDAVVNQDGVQRGKGAQENHRCDQCGKTFVTKASLKVLIDWLLDIFSAFFILI